MKPLAALARALAELPAGLRVPPPKVAAALVLLMFGFGVLVGHVARTSVQSTLLASARPPIKLLVHARTPSGSSGEAATGSALAAESEPPASEAQATPGAPAKSTPAPSAAHHARKAAGSAKGSGGGTSTRPARKLPAIKHVWLIVLSDEPYAAVFGPESAAHYLTQTLEPQGALLAHYDAIAHEQLANEIALVSGQGPTAETAANCPAYAAIAPATSGASQQVLGSGCVYPAATPTLPGELSARHLSWRGYVEGMDEAGCAHPVLGQPDASATAAGAYATFINPFAYFASITGSSECGTADVGIAGLKRDLAKAKRTPSFSYIAPSRCDDGAPTPCAPGAAAGMAPADAFLRRVVPEITSSPAYKRSGLLVITVDEAPSSGAFEDSSSCCGQPAYPNLPAALSTSPSGRPRGGGAVGALLLSPFIKGPQTSQEPYNHFSTLATIEQIFALKRLGYSALAAVKPLEPSIFVEAAG